MVRAEQRYWPSSSGPTSISMSSSTSSAAMSSAGWSRIERARNWPSSSSRRPLGSNPNRAVARLGQPAAKRRHHPADVPSATLSRLLAVNVNTTSIVTHTTLPLLLRHTATTGRRCALLNVGSIVGRFYWPGTQLYGACKAFIDHLTVPLAYEYREQLDVLSFQPTVMATAMAAGTEPAAITITPQAAARAALSHLGRCVTSHGHWRHAMAAALFRVLPSRLRNHIFLTTALEMGEAERAKGA